MFLISCSPACVFDTHPTKGEWKCTKPCWAAEERSSTCSADGQVMLNTRVVFPAPLGSPTQLHSDPPPRVVFGLHSSPKFSHSWSELPHTLRHFLCSGKTFGSFCFTCHYTLYSTVWHHSEILISTQHIHYVNPQNFKVACRECAVQKSQWIFSFLNVSSVIAKLLSWRTQKSEILERCRKIHRHECVDEKVPRESKGKIKRVGAGRLTHKKFILK